MLAIFKRNMFKPKKYQHPLKKQVHPNSVEAWKAKRKTVAVSQRQVLIALQKMGRPAHYRMISQFMKIMEGSVTPRIAELRRKGYIQVAYVNKGFNRAKVNYYELTVKGKKYLKEYSDTH